MATTAAPYGLRAVNLIGDQPYAGSTRQIKIASGYGANIYNGSVVKIHTDGTINIVTETGGAGDLFPAGTIGVFVGCEYTDPNLGYLIHKQYWPTGTVAADAVAYIVDDPNALFMAQCDATVAQAGLGMNTFFAAAQSTSTGSTTTGNSTSALDATIVATTGLGFRIVDFVDGPTSTVGDTYTDVIVKFNNGAHSYTNPVGSA